jgi:hypothetical protein
VNSFFRLWQADVEHDAPLPVHIPLPDADEQWAIQKGKVKGNRVTFEVHTDFPVLKFDLTLAGGHLKGEARGEFDGRTIKAAVDLQRKTD